MQTFLEWLNEVARWKRSTWKPGKDAMKALRKYNKPQYFASFTELCNKIGVNPHRRDTETPYGIYAYPVPYILKTHIIKLPLGGDMPCIWVFKARNPRKVLRIRVYGDKASKLWQKAYDAAQHDYTFSSVNQFFLNRKIEGFVDYGTSTIHGGEPTQAVFFGSHTIVPLEVIENNYKDEYIKNLEKELSAQDPFPTQDTGWEDMPYHGYEDVPHYTDYPYEKAGKKNTWDYDPDDDW